MSDKTDYEALEKSVKYIRWKGKNADWYIWHKTFLVRAMICGYHSILVGLEVIPTDETAKKLATLTNMMSNKRNNITTTKWTQEPMQTYYSVVLKTLYLSELWTRQKIRIWWTAIQHWHGNDRPKKLLDVLTPKKWNWLSNCISHVRKKWRPWHMDYKFGMSTTKNCRMWKDNQW